MDFKNKFSSYYTCAPGANIPGKFKCAVTLSRCSQRSAHFLMQPLANTILRDPNQLCWV